MKKAVTLLEIIVVVLIIGIIAAVFLPTFTKSKEDSLGREANLTLKLIQDAEQFYQIEHETYTDFVSTADANTILKLYIPAGSSANWEYKVAGATTSTFIAKAHRLNTTDPAYNRTYCINQSNNDSYSTGCTW